MLRKKADPIAFARDMIALRRPMRLKHRWKPPRDGLYRVVSGRRGGYRVQGGYLVVRGRVTRCSPAVKRRIHIWAMRYAEYFGDPFAC